ncbi:MAG: hypothetical protein L6Q83_02580, partial [Gammaproteobacteria bacterium]|nr:hypothetical protein [Gammaproteobacteria bacterium]
LYLGGDLNDAGDNLWFTLLFKRREVLYESAATFDDLVKIFLKGMAGESKFSSQQKSLIQGLAQRERYGHPVSWLSRRAESLLAEKTASMSALWGWKEPNTHIILDRLVRNFPTM